MADNPPLWQVMRDRYEEFLRIRPIPTEGERYAAEIRALADWLEAMWAAQRPSAEIPTEFAQGLSVGMEMHREGTLNILRAEADKAEAGE